MKKILIVTLITVLFSFVSCNTAANLQDNEVITINASEQSKAYMQYLTDNNVKDCFSEEGFPAELENLIALDSEQSFPDIEVSNKLEKESEDIYTLSNGDYENIVLYIHGGAWVYGIDPSHVTFCDELVNCLNAKVYMPLYPLAPKYTYKDTYKMVSDLYEKLLEQDKPVFVMGDSAGGTITLGLLHIIKENKWQMPAGVVVFHPCTDLTFSNPKMVEIETRDPMLAIYGCKECAKMWAGDKDAKDPAVSAVYSNVKNYPKMMLFIGTEDILSEDNLIFYEKMKKAGNDITLVKGQGLYHVFSVSNTPEKDQSLDLITDFCK